MLAPHFQNEINLKFVYNKFNLLVALIKVFMEHFSFYL